MAFDQSIVEFTHYSLVPTVGPLVENVDINDSNASAAMNENNTKPSIVDGREQGTMKMSHLDYGHHAIQFAPPYIIISFSDDLTQPMELFLLNQLLTIDSSWVYTSRVDPSRLQPTMDNTSLSDKPTRIDFSKCHLLRIDFSQSCLTAIVTMINSQAMTLQSIANPFNMIYSTLEDRLNEKPITGPPSTFCRK
ncbi:hypothetical protein TIFTF001_016945 [Ficus carica]|uniref:Uncharacterized protein n=1 Tax=Ficus carica TaxID=3494 RepID=A0AA88A8E1_FICCA|nr:hypothetical protein TIFTF001_016945 [Ficus carica]